MIKELQLLISKEVDTEIGRLNASKPENLYEPVGYALSMGGKRLRPVMVLLAYNLFRETIEEAYPAAMAIEVFHNFTLLHDDIMDRAEMRRNLPSVYKKYNENIAILSGDAMSIMAYNYLLKCRTGDLPSMISLFSDTALEVCEGQQYDMDFESRWDVTIAEYLEMIRLKTAVLLACSLKIGAMAAEAPARVANLLYDFGINLGIAFQLQDDLLDVFADQDKFGKKIGGDIVSNKKTFLLLNALELSEGLQKKELSDWISATNFDADEKVKAVTSIYNQLGIKAITEEFINKYYLKTLDLLGKMELNNQQHEQLLDLARMIMNRDH